MVTVMGDMVAFTPTVMATAALTTRATATVTIKLAVTFTGAGTVAATAMVTG